MGFSRTRFFEYKTFAAGELANALRTTLSHMLKDPENLDFYLVEKLEDGTSNLRKVRLSDLESVCDPTKQYLDAHFTGVDEGVYGLGFSGLKLEFIEIRLSCPKHSQLPLNFDRLIKILNLKELAEIYGRKGSKGEDIKEEISKVSERIKTLENSFYASQRNLRCFLSYRYIVQNELTVLKVKEFLSLLDVEVITGTSYEPRRISDKVLSMLTGPLDFLVLLVTREGESPWTRDEIATALQKGIPVVPLVENGVDFSPGLFGDLEYIPFDPNHVGDGFLKLLEAVHFLKKRKIDRQQIFTETSQETNHPTTETDPLPLKK